MEPIESQAPEMEVPAAPAEVTPVEAAGADAPVEAEAEVVAEEPSAEEPGELFLVPEEEKPGEDAAAEEQLKALLEAVVYVTEEPLTLEQIAAAVNEPKDRIQRLLAELTEEFAKPGHGLTLREVAGGYKMGTKPEHHEAIRQFVKSLKPPLKLSLAALETLAVIAYKQPITSPEIMEIRGVQGAGVLKTLLDRKLIATAGRKNVIGKPILYKTTKDFLVQFGLKDLAELPTLKEFEELRRLAMNDEPVLGLEAAPEPEGEAEVEVPAAEAPAEAVADEPKTEPAAAEAAEMNE
jgi:segregation and condensation protein B